MSELKSRPTSNERVAPISLAELVQLAELGARSECVRVERDATEGLLFIDRGSVVHASFGAMAGEAAARKIFSHADQPALRLPFEEPESRSMASRPSQLLLRFAVEDDELTRHEAPPSRRLNDESPEGELAVSEPNTPGTGSHSRGGPSSPGSASFRLATGTGKTGTGKTGSGKTGSGKTGSGKTGSGVTGTSGFKSSTGSYKTSGGSSKSGIQPAQRSDGWLWRAIALCFLAGGVSYSYTKYFAPKPPPSAQPAAALAEVDADSLTGLTDVVPRLIEAPAPRRPDQEIALQPTIVVRALIGGDGSVKQAAVPEPRPSVQAFEAAAVEAVKRYRFKPAQRGGQVVAAWMNIPVGFAFGAGHSTVVIRGSLGLEPLAQSLERVFVDSGATASLKLDFDGASPCLAALLESEAQVCITSRAIRPDELEDAKAVGVQIQEQVLGWTHAAVVMHPLNPILELNLSQLAGLFEGKHKNWSALGGEDWPVMLLGTSQDSSPSDAFRSSVLTASGTEVDFAADLGRVRDTKELFATVAKTPGAVAFAATQDVAAELKKANDYIKPVAVLASNGTAVLPTSESFAKRAYPIRSEVRVYSLATPDEPTHQLLSLLFSKAGRALALQNDIAQGPQVQVPPFRTPAGVKAPAVYHVEFIAGSVGLDVGARFRLDQVALKLAQSEKLWAVIIGHADSVSEPSQQDALAEKRVEAVERYLTSGGLASGRVERRTRGVSRPRSGKGDRASQLHNRRVDIFLVERD
ncbi:MAG: hypothetical protein RJA70_1349 [Pseudomonadota bacterium]|jgi:TonB family protein